MSAKSRVTFDSKDRRRDQRRAIMLPGSLDGIQVELTDIGFRGVGGSVKDTGDTANLTVDEDHTATLEFVTGAGLQVAVEITLEWLDPYTGAFGGSFVQLTSKQFDTIETVMFPGRHRT